MYGWELIATNRLAAANVKAECKPQAVSENKYSLPAPYRER